MKPLLPGNIGKETTYEVRNHDTPLDPEAYHALPKHPVYLILDNLRSAFNVGALFRLADTARLAQVITCGYTAHPPHPKLDKTALGTLEYVPTIHFETTLEAVRSLQEQSIPVWALETISHAKCYTQVSYPQPLGLILGNEALGVNKEVLEHCDAWIEIPMYGFKNSLNVAAAGAVVSFEILRQWGSRSC